jgi:hypothetical protein
MQLGTSCGMYPDNLFAHLRLAATYVLIDRQEKVGAEASEVVRINPKSGLN